LSIRKKNLEKLAEELMYKSKKKTIMKISDNIIKKNMKNPI